MLDKEKLNFCVLFLSSCLSLSGPQWRDKLTPPQSLFVSFIPTETFQRERSVNIHHRKTGVWPPRRPLHSAVILIILGDTLSFYLGLSALIMRRRAQCLLSFPLCEKSVVSTLVPTPPQNCPHYKCLYNEKIVSVCVCVSSLVCLLAGAVQHGGPPVKRSEPWTGPMRRCGVISGRRLRPIGRFARMSGAGSNRGWPWLTSGERCDRVLSLPVLVNGVKTWLLIPAWQYLQQNLTWVQQETVLKWKPESSFVIFADALSALTIISLLLPSIVPLCCFLLLAVRGWRTAPGSSSMKMGWKPAWPSQPAAPSTTVLPTTPQTLETPLCCATMTSAKLTLGRTSMVRVLLIRFLSACGVLLCHVFTQHSLWHGKMKIAL